MIRVHGDVRRINLPPMEHKDVHGMVYDIMNDGQRKFYEENLECDFSFAVPNLARFRVNAFVQQRGAGAVLRTIPSKVLSLEDLKAPKIFAEIADQPRGIVLVTGPTGSGKSTTLAGDGQPHQRERARATSSPSRTRSSSCTKSKKCLINQREVGPHTLSFANALRSALREDPDVILVGEMRDLETIRLALTARRDRPPGVRHAAHQLRGQDHRPDHRRVPGGGKGNGARDAVGVAARGHLADAAQDQGRQRARRGARDHDRHAGDPQPDPREQDRADVLGDPDRPARSACRRSTRTCRSWCKRNIISSAEARGKAANKDNFQLGSGSTGTQEQQWNENRPSNSSTTCCALMVAKKGSDLFITAGFPPAIKVDGKMTPVSKQALTPQHTAELARA